MPLSATEFSSLLERALDNLPAQPKDLAKVLAFFASLQDIRLDEPLGRLVRHIDEAGPNDIGRHALTRRIQGWDHADKPDWSPATAPHSAERRRDVLTLLGLPEQSFEQVNKAVPVYTDSDIPVVIARTHKPWYEKRKPFIRDFYWKHYRKQLEPPRGNWSSDSVTKLDVSTDDVLARLSDPTLESIYQVKGLVMGYVQSGKTSHFSGLIAKAADAGYRLVIVLAGLMDILREQTQRRIDKEIVGQELLGPEEYGTDTDWDRFVSHGGRPSDLGHFDWQRLTSRHDDFNLLKQNLDRLEFRAVPPANRFNIKENLNAAPARLVVIKKTPTRINRLCADLKRLQKLRTQLEYVPTLIIDDESDQASVNTIDRRKPGKSDARTSTNAAIAKLLKLLPRAQYVGYTATPFANVFIDVEDAEDLFPKDFIVSLPRPDGYMGVRDFYDFDGAYEKDDVRSNEGGFVRPVTGDNEEDKNLPKAIDSFVLAGAIKLFRQDQDPEKYGFRHHTMLIHHSARKAVHSDDAADVLQIFGSGARYQKKAGLRRLEKLLEEDFRPVAKAHDPEAPFPSSLAELTKFISECVTKLCDDEPVLIVNGDNKEDTPDFEQKPVWAILVGGAKLSRGYTVEGLTTSYFRRPAGAGDTLMQMGRWFGFRWGYRDLVRLFIGTEELRGKKKVNLYEAFEAVCRDEEALREELLRYGKGGITPQQVPPLVRQHLPQLPPAAKNKMFNAQIRSQDFAGTWTEKTLAPSAPKDIKYNRSLAGILLGATKYLGHQDFQLTSEKGIQRKFAAEVGIADGQTIAEFLKNYRWSDGKKRVWLEYEYLVREREAGRLTEWLILAPQVDNSRRREFVGGCFPELSVVGRSRVSTGRFNVYSEPRHRDIAGYLAGISGGTTETPFLAQYRDKARGAFVFYLVEDKGNSGKEPTVGFGIQFPGKKKLQAIIWSVADPSRADEVVVSASRP